jgi:hypothetical protein
MFGIGKIIEEVKDLKLEVKVLKEEQAKIKATAQQDEMALRREIGKAIEVLLTGEPDTDSHRMFYRQFEKTSDFMDNFKYFITNRVREGVTKDMSSEFDKRINEKFIDEIVSRINRKQVG